MKVQFVGVYQGPANLYKNTDLDAANLCSLFTQEEGARWRENIVKKKNTFRDLFPGKDFMPSTWGNALVKQWLGGFVEVPPDANVLHTIYHAFEPWALRGIQREKREPLWLEFKEPPGLGALCINKEARIKQINHEFENGTLLVKCGVT
jgi:hypothetical protein